MAEESKNVETVETNVNAKDNSAQEESKSPTLEELMAELAKERAEKVKLKNSLDSTASEAARYKKALREKQTAEEIQNEEKLKAEEQRTQYIKELEAYKAKAEAKSRYALQGMSAELANQAAEAEVNGDYDLLAEVHKKHTDAILKAKEAEWYKNRPDPNVGNGGEDKEKDPFLAGFNSSLY